MAIFDTTKIGDLKQKLGLKRGPFSDDTDYLKDHWGQEIVFTHIASGRTVEFKAFLKSFRDRYNSKWKATSGYGRMDPVQTFQNTSRTIAISFDVVAASKKEAQENMKKVSLLTNMLYPAFEGHTGGQTIKSAPLVRLKFMNWAESQGGPGAGSGLLGSLSGFTFSPNLEVGVFGEGAGRKTFKGKKAAILPKTFNISTNLNVIHEHELGWKFARSAKVMSSNNPRKPIDLYEAQTTTFPYGSDVTPPKEKPSGKEKNTANSVAAKHEITGQ